MECPYDEAGFAKACRDLILRNELDECYLRPLMIRGYGAAGLNPFASPVESYVVCWPWGAYLGDEGLERGVDVCVSSWQRPGPNTHPVLAKAGGNYLSSQLIKMEALANGYSEGIALGPEGLISEGSGQNIFLVRDGVLITPPVDGSLLSGITRDSIRTIAREMGIDCQERTIPREMLYTADELFFTGTAAEVTPVRSVDRILIGSGKAGALTLRLQRQFMDIVEGRIEDRHGWLTIVPEP
jgi:branched-chain amino acid aminotransferase